jgi:hypothetical protein
VARDGGISFKKFFDCRRVHRKFTGRAQVFHTSGSPPQSSRRSGREGAMLDATAPPTYAGDFMTQWRLAGALLALVLVARPPGAAAAPTPEAALLRVFLDDGTALASFGEPARLGDRVVFSMPTSASLTEPRLHLVTIPASRVDWPRTTRYAESVRAAQYLATRAEAQYVMLTSEITQALNDVALTSEPAGRLAIVERARRTLADWPGRHYGYKQDEIQRMLSILDEAIADLRAAAGVERFDLSFVAAADPSAAREPLLPPPDPRETIEQTLAAARLSDAATERMSLLAVAIAAIDRDAAILAADWSAETRAKTSAALAMELAIERRYRQLQTRVVRLAAARARLADVRGIQRLVAEIRAEDKVLGGRRPETVASLLAVVETELDAARRLRLERDRWALRLPDLRKYHTAFLARIEHFETLRGALEDIKALAGSGPGALTSIQRAAAEILQAMTSLTPPDEYRSAHGLIVSAAHLADNAARIRREAALAGDLARAWDASSAAAGALMLSARARVELPDLFRLPKLLR